MAPRKPKVKKQPLAIRSFSLTGDNDNVLGHLSQEASDFLGWTVSDSAVIRALLQYAAQQPTSWASSTLFPFIEHEIAAGTFWGRHKK